MSEAKHTPGPWFVSPYGVGFEVDSANGQSIAQAQQIAPNKKPEDHEERKANARLIASAPELLEALHVVRRSVGWSVMSDAAQSLVEAAIAKATGQT